jgi:NAD(P)-dependent dehydrogenase (short-subunit alcohol dehydrogenase family)
MKVFIVGIAGNTGSRVARLLVEKGDTVSGLYRRPEQGGQLRALGAIGTLGDIATISEMDLASGAFRSRRLDLCCRSRRAGRRLSEWMAFFNGRQLGRNYFSLSLLGQTMTLLSFQGFTLRSHCGSPSLLMVSWVAGKRTPSLLFLS